MRILLFIFMLSFTSIFAQDNVQLSMQDPVCYLLKNVLLRNRGTGALVLLPLDVKKIIIHLDPDREASYWLILQKYFPESPKDTLKERISLAPWLDPSLSLKGFKFFFPVTKGSEIKDRWIFYQKTYHYTAIYSISNPFFSKDGNTCIIYVNGLQQGAFTVEIKKDVQGKWTSHTMTVDWIS